MLRATTNLAEPDHRPALVSTLLQLHVIYYTLYATRFILVALSVPSSAARPQSHRTNYLQGKKFVFSIDLHSLARCILPAISYTLHATPCMLHPIWQHPTCYTLYAHTLTGAGSSPTIHAQTTTQLSLARRLQHARSCHTIHVQTTCCTLRASKSRATAGAGYQGICPTQWLMMY